MATDDIFDAIIVFRPNFFYLSTVIKVNSLVLGKASDDRSQRIPAEWTFH
jgi:hypothetical protein